MGCSWIVISPNSWLGIKICLDEKFRKMEWIHFKVVYFWEIWNDFTQKCLWEYLISLCSEWIEIKFFVVKLLMKNRVEEGVFHEVFVPVWRFLFKEPSPVYVGSDNVCIKIRVWDNTKALPCKSDLHNQFKGNTFYCCVGCISSCRQTKYNFSRFTGHSNRFFSFLGFEFLYCMKTKNTCAKSIHWWNLTLNKNSILITIEYLCFWCCSFLVIEVKKNNSD